MSTPALRGPALVIGLGIGLAAMLPACTVRDTVATAPDQAGDAGDGSAPDAPTRDQYCEGQGPPILVGDGRGMTDICAGELAARTFRHALCACQELTLNDALGTDSFDSRNGPYETGGDEGSVGINGKIEATASIDIRGALTVAGELGIHAGPMLAVAGELAAQGPLDSPDTAAIIDGSARIGGNVRLASLRVAGTLTLPADAALEVPGTLELGAETRAAVAVAPPCACALAELIDIGGYVEAHRLVNHNDEIGLDPESLAGFSADTALELPCGRFYLSRVQSDTGNLTLVIAGRTALFIGQGGINLGRSLTVEVLPGGELDLFVAGHINVAGDIGLGTRETPARVRLYAGGAGAINLSAQSTVGGNLYAPLVDLSLAASAEFFGSVFVNRLLSAGPVTLHYDTSVREAAALCPLPGPG